MYGNINMWVNYLQENLLVIFVHLFYAMAREYYSILLILGFIGCSFAQYIQNYTFTGPKGQEVLRHQHTAGEKPQDVMVLDPKSTVVLEYNCYYMRAICLHSERWLRGDGKNRFLTTIEKDALDSTRSVMI
jgi:hypothetical protein